jgi:hypothetical protein
MPGFLDSLRQMQFNRTFANAGQPYNDMLGRYGNQLPPSPMPRPDNMGNGFLDGLMMQQGAMVPPTGLSPAEAQASEVRAPQPQMGFLDRLQSGVEDNRGMLMGLGSGLLSRGWAGVGDAMPGMEYDENRRAMEEQQAQMEAQRAAQMRLGEQYGVDPLMFEAGMGDFALQQALTPSAPPEMTSRMRELAAAGIDFSSPEGREALLRGSGVNVNVGGGEVGTIPQGYELFTDPETGARRLQPLPGGPEDTQGEVDSARNTASNVIVTAATRALGAANNRSVDGVLGRVASIDPSTANAEVYRQVSSLQAIASAEALNAMRRQSPTGGALGNVTERELDLLRQQSGALDPASPNFERDLADYTRSLLRTVHGYEDGSRVFEEQLGGAFSATQQQAPASVDPEVWQFMTPEERALWN